MGRMEADSPVPSHAPLPARIRVVPLGGHWSVRAAGPIAAGEVILTVVGRLVSTPSRHSLQVSARRHIEAPGGLPPQEMVATYGWRFLNHACDPNAALRGPELVALRHVDRDEEITFDYNTTEWDMADPFRCECGAAACYGRVRGFKHLDAEARERILPRVAEHLRARVDRGSEAAPSTGPSTPPSVPE